MTGVLLIQLGTPDQPTTPALRRYLRQFLGDPRVIETPTFWARRRWRLVLNLIILPTRPAQSAAKSRRIWDAKTGSPLLHITRLQTAALQQLLPDVPVRFGMQVGNPPVADVLREMIRQGVDRLIVLPMYPQYSATTNASATDVLFSALLKKLRELARHGVRRVFVATPGFTTDCLETIDEIGYEAAEAFKHAGGEALHRCPCLNDHPAWVRAMQALVLEEGKGWL